MRKESELTFYLKNTYKLTHTHTHTHTHTQARCDFSNVSGSKANSFLLLISTGILQIWKQRQIKKRLADR